MQSLMGGVEKIRHQISVQNRVRNSADDVSVVSNQPIVVYINNMAATLYIFDILIPPRHY